MALHIRRARPLLGTFVAISLEIQEDPHGTLPQAHAAIDAAFAAITAVGRAMSAHHPDSDVGRIARAAPGSVLVVDRHTARVIELARHWCSLSRGAFDPCAAAERLARQNLRPAFHADGPAGGALRQLRVISATEILVERPLQLDLGGIAKGYAVDLAIEALRSHGIGSALVNAGGDLRAFGPRAWPVEVRGHVGMRSAVPRALRRAHNAAIASSEAKAPSADFVRTARRPGITSWQSCTVLAPDCVTADALTKWGLQAAEASQRLRRALRIHGAQLWRS